MIAGPNNSSGDAYAELHLKGKQKYTCILFKIFFKINGSFVNYILLIFVSLLYTDGKCKGEDKNIVINKYYLIFIVKISNSEVLF